jgi:hypothetical protein
MQQEERQQGSLLVGTGVEEFAVPENLEGPKDVELHSGTS